MFNLFGKKKEETKRDDLNPIADVFYDLTTNQKMSIINLLLTMFFVDGEPNYPDKGMQYINTYIKILGVRYDDCNAYLSQGKTVIDLKPISIAQKELIFTSLWAVMTINGQPSENALNSFIQLFAVLGIKDEKFIIGFAEKMKLMRTI